MSIITIKHNSTIFAKNNFLIKIDYVYIMCLLCKNQQKQYWK